jgi:shikimate dehydrogenase
MSETLVDAAPVAPRLAAVIGWPAAHSLSPLIHATWAARERVNSYYIPVAASPTYEGFARVADGLRAAGFKGVNVTLPHKENALRYAGSASEEAKAAGAANMLTFDEAGVFAENSDIFGFASALNEVVAEKRSALVIGAGGAARGVVLALARRCGVSRISVVNRTREKSDAVAALVGGAAIDWAKRNDAIAGVDVVVNATSLGMARHPPLDIDARAIDAGAVVCDIVYAPLETPLLKAARAGGRRTVDGLSMLMHQAAPGYRKWLGAKADVDADLRERLEQALAARSA